MARSKILIVEDDPIVLMSAAQALRAGGGAVLEAESADMAATILNSEAGQVAVVFSDIDMPGALNGLTLAHAIGEQWPAIAVVLASGHAIPTPAELTPCVRFIRKPYNLAHVSEIILDLSKV